MNQSYEEFINFLKSHKLYDKDMFCYIRMNSIVIDYRVVENRTLIKCNYFLNKDESLKRIELYVPYLNSPITTLINIYEYVYAALLYKYLNKPLRIDENELKTLPILYASLYAKEKNSDELLQYINDLNNQTNNNSSFLEYQSTLIKQEKLLDYYEQKKPNLNQLQNKAKKLTKKYTKNN